MRRAHGIPQGQKNHNQRIADKIPHSNDQAILYSSLRRRPGALHLFLPSSFLLQYGKRAMFRYLAFMSPHIAGEYLTMQLRSQAFDLQASYRKTYQSHQFNKSRTSSFSSGSFRKS